MHINRRRMRFESISYSDVIFYYREQKNATAANLSEITHTFQKAIQFLLIFPREIIKDPRPLFFPHPYPLTGVFLVALYTFPVPFL